MTHDDETTMTTQSKNLLLSPTANYSNNGAMHPVRADDNVSTPLLAEEDSVLPSLLSGDCTAFRSPSCVNDSAAVMFNAPAAVHGRAPAAQSQEESQPPPAPAAAAAPAPEGVRQLSVELSISQQGAASPDSDLLKLYGERKLPGGTITQEKLLEVVSAYAARTLCEEVDMLKELGGTGQVLWDLKVSPHEGLSTEEQIAYHKKIGGVNKIPKKAETPFIKLFWDACRDPMLTVLICCSIISILLGAIWGENPKIEWIEGASMLAAVLIVILVTSINDYVKEKRFASLAEEESKRANVVRGGQNKVLDASKLVVGDIIIIETGDEIPADVILLSQHGLLLDEASISGESELLQKKPLEDCLKDLEAKQTQIDQVRNLTAHEAHLSKKTESPHHMIPSPVLLAGSAAACGSGTAVVIAVGTKSQTGKMFQKLLTENEATPLQQKLNALARHVGLAGFIAAVATLVILIFVYVVTFKDMEVRPTATQIAHTLIEYVVTAITIVVVAVPEGLPLAVTISLAFSIHLMLKDQNYVRRLTACETMGGATEICSDKTGTLTKNQMEVTAYWNGSHLAVDIADPRDIIFPPGPYSTAFVHNIAVNSTAYLDKKEVEIADKSKRTKQVVKPIGSPTECAFLQMIEARGYDYDLIRKVFAGKEATELLGTRMPAERSSGVSSQRSSVSEERSSGEDSSAEGEMISLTTDLVKSGSGGNMYDYCSGMLLIVDRIPFSSDRKAMSTCVRHPYDANKLRVFTKGASEVILKRCRFRVNGRGELKRLSDPRLQKIEASVINTFADRSLRSICLAFRDFVKADIPDWNTFEDSAPTQQQQLIQPQTSFWKIENEMICLGIAGIRDPLRAEVPGAVRKCQEAGIKIRMCTGDNLRVARQIALDAQIHHPERGGIVMLGPDFYQMVGKVVCKACGTEECACPRAATVAATDDTTSNLSSSQHSSPGGLVTEIVDKDAGAKSSCGQCGCCGGGRHRHRSKTPAVDTKNIREDVLGNPEAFDRIADRLEVLARSQPNDKHALVLGLRQRGAIVAVTGDGVNDAPALKCADVGFAMGIAGKEVTKRAADIILLDDNFESIVKACKWGRNIYDNIQRFLQFQLTVNLVAVATALVGAIALKESPLTAIQLLWVNLIMDTFAALALATEPPTDALLERPPRRRDEYLVNKQMVCNIAMQILYQLAVLFSIIFSGECWLPEFGDEASLDVLLENPGYSRYSLRCGGGHTVRSGRRYRLFSNQEDYKRSWYKDLGPSRHYTYVFNVFVMMQVFNLVNTRRINPREFNIFENIWANHIWKAIVFLIVVGQALLLQFGRAPIGCHPHGLTWQQWMLCIAFGLGTWLAAVVGKLVPASWVEKLPQTGRKEVDPFVEPTSFVLASRGRISSGRVYARMHVTDSLGQNSYRGSAYLPQTASFNRRFGGGSSRTDHKKLARRLTAAARLEEQVQQGDLTRQRAHSVAQQHVPAGDQTK